MPQDNGMRVSNISRARHIAPDILKPILSEPKQVQRPKSRTIKQKATQLRYIQYSSVDSRYESRQSLPKLTTKLHTQESSQLRTPARNYSLGQKSSKGKKSSSQLSHYSMAEAGFTQLIKADEAVEPEIVAN